MASLIRNLNSRYLNSSLKTGKGFTTRIIDRPGRWMSEKQLNQLSADLRTVATKTLDAGSLTYGVFAADPQQFNDSIITLVSRSSDGKPVAFNALVRMEIEVNGVPTEVLHLGLVMVDPDEQGQGFSWVLYGLTCFLLFLRRGFRPIYISNVTQVPAVVGMVSQTFSDVFPQPGQSQPRDFAKVLIAREILAHKRQIFGVGAEAVFDETAFTIHNAYTGGSDSLKKTFAQTAKHREASYNDFCAERLDYARGDDLIQVGKIDLAAARRYIAHNVPRRSLAGVGALFLLIAMRRVVLPIVHWFDASTRYGILRARS